MRGRTGARTGWILVALAGVLTLVCGPALAIPPGGPAPDTPGTGSRVWPTTVRPGDTLNFEVSGYPANETVYIKIDDGKMCKDTSHGACVYHTQKLNSKGYARGSLKVPATLGAGKHWLRMLATGDVHDKKTGEYLGYKGYTRRGGNDFTVVASGTTGGKGGSSGSQGGSGTAAESDAADQSQGTAGADGKLEGGTISLDAGSSSPAAPSPEAPSPVAPSADAVAESSAEVQPVGRVVAASDESGVPVAGIGILAGAVVLGGGAVSWAALRRRRLAKGA